MAVDSLSDIIAIAQKKGEAREALEKRNSKRKAKGRKPLPDEQERKDMDVLRKKYRTADATTVDGMSALKLFEMRKAAMIEDSDPDDPDDQMSDINPPPVMTFTPKPDRPAKQPQKPAPQPVPQGGNEDYEAVDRAQKEAEAVRRIQDMKNGRIDHDGNWSAGQKIEGGDSTQFPTGFGAATEQELPKPSAHNGDADEAFPLPDNAVPGLKEFMLDLYDRLRVSFGAIESTLSDLQGRVAEIVTASANTLVAEESGKDEFERLLSRKTPVTFDVGGTRMTFDAVTVFHASPCITVVSKSGSATIMPKPGATLNLTYEMDGVKYENDPVTFLGTRFDLPMFGLSFVGFIRDEEANQLDVAAGVSET